MEGHQYIVLLFLAVLQCVSSQCEVGTRESTGEARTANSFYLNSNEPINCTGTIDSFTFCYYRPFRILRRVNRYSATFALYRLNPQGTDYISVSSTFTASRTQQQIRRDFRIRQQTFSCSTLSLSQPLSVETGDVFGACVVDPSGNSVFRLDMVGTGTTTLRRVPQGCSDTAVPTSVSATESNTVTGTLYIQATVRPTITTTSPITTTEEPTQSRSESPNTMEDVTTIALATTNSIVTEEVFTERNFTGSLLPESTNNASDTAIIAGAVVVVSIVMSATLAALVVIIFVLKRKIRETSPYAVSAPPAHCSAIDNMSYETELATKRESGHYHEISQEHFYELTDNSKSDFNSSCYAEVGPFEGDQVDENIYEVPLDSDMINFIQLVDKNKEEDIYGFENPYQVPATSERPIYDQFDSWGVVTLTSASVKVTGHLGSGQFGSVEQGVWKRQGTKPVDVALKSLTKTSEEDRVKFLQEAAIMAQFKHPNVIMLYGVINESHSHVTLVVELAKKGDLHNHLRSLRPDPGQLLPNSIPTMLLKFSQQVALGMQYLSAKGFVHRDLAARNVLVTANNQCKVADFGMSRDLADENYYVSQGKDKIPVKWTAPEAIHYKKYSTASDVWAYGCLLYEIWSLGHKPFGKLDSIKAIELVDDGKRLSPPPGCSKLIYKLMIDCWHPETSQRPGFRDVVLTLVGNEEMVLSIPEEDSSSHPLAGVLGATLEAGENMYTQLQNIYIENVQTTSPITDADNNLSTTEHIP